MNASPWSKYFCASGLDVVTDRVCSPRPVYWITLDLDAPSGLVGSPSTELGPTATAAESAINIRMFLDRMMGPPFIFVSSLVSRAGQRLTVPMDRLTGWPGLLRRSGLHVGFRRPLRTDVCVLKCWMPQCRVRGLLSKPASPRKLGHSGHPAPGLYHINL